MITQTDTLDAQIEDAEASLAIAETALGRAARAGQDLDGPATHVERAQHHLEILQARRTRHQTLEKLRVAEAEKATLAVKAHEKAVKANAAALKKEKATLAASRKKADDAVKAAGVAVVQALQALGEHTDNVHDAAGRLTQLGLLLTDEYGNRFQEGAQRGLTASVALDGDHFSTRHPGDREKAVQDVVKRAVEAQRPATSSWRQILRDAEAQRQAGRDGDAERARRNPNIRRA